MKTITTVLAVLALAAAALAQGFAINVTNPSAVDRHDLAIASIAVPRGLSSDLSGVALIDDRGLSVPVEFRALARWDADREDRAAPLRWVQAAFPVKFAAGSTRTFYAVFGKPRPGMLSVEGLHVDTGAMALDVPPTAMPLAIEPRIDDTIGTVIETTVETSNTVMAVIRQTGALGALKFTARWQFSTGSTVVNLQFRVENPASASTAVHFSEITLRVPSKGAVGVQRIMTAMPRATLGRTGTIGVAVDRPGENYPKAIRSDGVATFVDLWPVGGNGPLFGGQYWNGKAPGTDLDATTRYRFEGGRWKTHTIVLDLGGSIPATEPIIGTVDPGWTMGSGALGQLVAAARPPGTSIESDRFNRMQRVLVDDLAADDQPSLGRIGLPEFRRRGGTYVGQGPEMWGWANFGDIAWGDGYSSNHYALDWCVLVGFLRTGDYRFFDIGRDLVAHRRDYDQRHSIGDANRGGASYEKGYSHGNYERPLASHTWVQGLCLHYLLTGDEGTRETILEAGAWYLRLRPDRWDGWWGSRIIGWQIEALVHLWNTTGDPSYLKMARAAAARYAVLEAGNGYWPNPGSKNMIPNSPIHEQTWMHAIVLSAIAKLQIADPDPARLPLIARMAAWIEKRMVRPDGKVWDRARGTLTDAPDDWHSDVNAHHAWLASDALTYASVVTGDAHWLDVARPLFTRVVRNHQGGAGPGFDPIAFRMTTFPNSETKVNAGAVLWGQAFLSTIR